MEKKGVTMRASIKNFWPVLAATLIAGLVAGCGDSTRNDQGVSVSFNGWAPTGSTCPPDQGITTLLVPIADTFITGGGGIPDQEVGGDTIQNSGSVGGAVFLTAFLDNFLAFQGIRVDRAFHEYHIPGAGVEVPSTSVGVSLTLGPDNTGVGDDQFGQDSTLPEGFSGLGSQGCANIPLIPADVRTFINLNRTAMPEPPFVMVVRTYVSGVTTGGNRVDSNAIEFEVVFTTDVVLPPTAGAGVGVGGATSDTSGSTLGSATGDAASTTADLSDTSSSDGFSEVGTDGTSQSDVSGGDTVEVTS